MLTSPASNVLNSKHSNLSQKDSPGKKALGLTVRDLVFVECPGGISALGSAFCLQSVEMTSHLPGTFLERVKMGG